MALATLPGGGGGARGIQDGARAGFLLAGAAAVQVVRRLAMERRRRHRFSFSQAKPSAGARARGAACSPTRRRAHAACGLVR